MGMFDYVRCNVRLPMKREAQIRNRGNPFQSKSVRAWEMPKFESLVYDHGALTLEISENFRLYGPDGQMLDWSGNLVFYGPVPGVIKWVEFSAAVAGGHVLALSDKVGAE